MLKMVAPIRMNITNEDSRVVEASACLSSDQDRRPRSRAMMSAPTAPMAPPSVGEATPRKMVPSTRKMSSSGGISTKVTRSASLDRSPRPVRRLAEAISQATKAPPQAATTTFSSVGTDSTRWPSHQLWMSAMCDSSTHATRAEITSTATSEG